MRKSALFGFFGIGGYRPESELLFARMDVALSEPWKIIYNEAIDGLITSGWWNELDVIHITNLVTEQQGTLNLKGNFNNLTNVNSLEWTTKVGYKNLTGITKYIHSSFIDAPGQKFGEDGRYFTFLNVFDELNTAVYWMQRATGTNYWAWRVRNTGRTHGYLAQVSTLDATALGSTPTAIGFNAALKNSLANVRFINNDSYMVPLTETLGTGVAGNVKIDYLRALGTNCNWIGIGKSRGDDMTHYESLKSIISTFNSKVALL